MIFQPFLQFWCVKTEDYIGCHFDTRGIFSVKSACKVQMDYENDRQGTSASVAVQFMLTGDQFPWKKIWNMPCANKVKFFAWRLAHISLPLM
jgi:hypothetical protein